MEIGRTLLTALLVVLFISLWMQWVQPLFMEETRPEESPVAGPETANGEGTSEEERNSPDAGGGVGPRTETIEAAPVTESLRSEAGPPWEVLLSSRGGGVVSWSVGEAPAYSLRLEELLLESGPVPVGGIRVKGEGWSDLAVATWEPHGAGTYRLALDNGLVWEKRWRPASDGAPYALDLHLTVRNEGEGTVAFAYRLFGPLRIRTESGQRLGYAREGMILVPVSETRFSVDEEDPGEIFEEGFSSPDRRPPLWVLLRAGYFLAGVRPGTEGGSVPDWIETGGLEGDPAPDDGEKDRPLRTWLDTKRVEIPPGGSVSHPFRIVAGPVHVEALGPHPGLDTLLPGGPIRTPLLGTLRLMHRISGNWGWAIILLTVVIRLLLVPLSWKTQAAMIENQHRMRRLRPRIKQIEERHGKNPKRKMEEMQKLYKEEGLVAAQMRGCLPMLLQIPIFFSLWRVLQESVELYHAPFVLWIQDLTAPDRIGALPFALPILGSDLNLIPILTVVLMFLNMKISAAHAAATTPDPDMQRQQKTMQWVMLAVMSVIFYNLASGVLLYVLVSTAWGLAEMRWIRARLTVGEET